MNILCNGAYPIVPDDFVERRNTLRRYIIFNTNHTKKMIFINLFHIDLEIPSKFTKIEAEKRQIKQQEMKEYVGNLNCK